MERLNIEMLTQALEVLGERLELDGAGPIALVVCGGSALIATGLVARDTTKDVDIVALTDGDLELLDPEPLPDYLVNAANQTRIDLGLPLDWLNNGPSRGDGGIYRAGLPVGLLGRASRRQYGPRLTVYFIGRLDQIYFKLAASADQGGGRHLQDLQDLEPIPEELEDAARWACTYDPSEGFAWLVRELVRKMGHDAVANRL